MIGRASTAVPAYQRMITKSCKPLKVLTLHDVEDDDARHFVPFLL